MRIISQDGSIDVPYETTSLSISTANTIIVYPLTAGTRGTMIAHYSTEEKVKKAMEMLHNTYTGVFLAQNVEVAEGDMKELIRIASTQGFGIIKTCTNSSETKFEPANIVFRFPNDDEV